MNKKVSTIIVLVLLLSAVSVVSASNPPSDIVIDGFFSEWDNGVGNDVCIADEGGPGDQGPDTSGIEGYCIGTNEVDTLFLLGASNTHDDYLADAYRHNFCIKIDVPPTPASQTPDGIYDFDICYRQTECESLFPYNSRLNCEFFPPDPGTEFEYIEINCMSNNVCNLSSPINVTNFASQWLVHYPFIIPHAMRQAEFVVTFNQVSIQAGDTICTKADDGPDTIFNDPNDEYCYTLPSTPTNVTLLELEAGSINSSPLLVAFLFVSLSMISMTLFRFKKIFS